LYSQSPFVVRLCQFVWPHQISNCQYSALLIALARETRDSSHQQILLNFLGNATKFTSPRGLNTIGATRSTNSDAVWIDARDSGIHADCGYWSFPSPTFFSRLCTKTRRSAGAVEPSVVSNVATLFESPPFGLADPPYSCLFAS
jgi:hypothetical protein